MFWSENSFLPLYLPLNISYKPGSASGLIFSLWVKYLFQKGLAFVGDVRWLCLLSEILHLLNDLIVLQGLRIFSSFPKLKDWEVLLTVNYSINTAWPFMFLALSSWTFIARRLGLVLCNFPILVRLSYTNNYTFFIVQDNYFWTDGKLCISCKPATYSLGRLNFIATFPFMSLSHYVA